MTTKYYVNKDGIYTGAFDGVKPPKGSIEVLTAPEDARQVWDGVAWGEVPAQPEPDPQTATEKLANFLWANPDVMELINGR